MAFYVVQGGSTLKKMTTAGSLTSLTLPTGVNVDSGKRLRGAVLGNLLVLVGSPDENLTCDLDGNLRPMSLRPPATAVGLGTTAGGGLTGTFKVKETYYIKDAYGNIIVESDFGPESAEQAVSGAYLTAVPTKSTQDISGRRLYRTTTGPGSTYFPWMDLDGNNAAQTIRDDLSDAGLQLIAAPTDLGTAPKFELLAMWKERLWGKPANDIDTLWQSAANKPYAWPRGRTFSIPPERNDSVGISGFIIRKDELIVGRQDRLFKIVGQDNSSFARRNVSEQIGIWAADSCTTAHDVGYFLGNPFGVYKLDASGPTNITDAKVKAWFSTDTYFNRSMFDEAVGFYDPLQHAYILLLAAAGSSDLDRWIQYNIATDTWWGPHKTAAFTPTGGVMLRDANNVAIPVIFGSDGKLYKPTTTKTDGSSSAIDFDCYTNYFSGGNPDITHTWLQPTIVTKIQAGGTLSVIPKVGKFNAAEGSSISHTMTRGNETLRRLGSGELCQIRLRENTAGQDVVVHGLELPFFEDGKRSG
jgi:hypothetical protein